MRYCSQCGAKLGDTERFCPFCGTAVGQRDPEVKNNGPAESGAGTQGYGSAESGAGAQGYGSPESGAGSSNTASQGAAGGWAGTTYGRGFTYDPVGTVDILTARMRTLSTAWLVIGIIQIVSGVCSLCVVVGIAPLALGIYNVVQSSKIRKTAEGFEQWPVGIFDYFMQRETSVIVLLILNLVLGFVFGIIGSILEFWVKGYATDHREELRMAEDMARRSAQA